MFPIPVSAVEAVAMPWEFAGGFQRPLIEPLLRFAQNRWEISFSSTADTYTVSGKKGATLFLPVTLRNANRFSKFFYHHTLQ